MSLPIWNSSSGILATLTEGDFYSFQFDYSNASELVFLSGELPSGLEIDFSNGFLSGQVSNIDISQVYEFTLRLKNLNGVSDRNFAIEVLNQQPTWITPQIIVQSGGSNYRQEQLFNRQFQINDPGFSNVRYEHIKGELPKGLQFFNNGVMRGFLDPEPNTYEFTIRAFGSETLDRNFTFVVEDDSQNRPPYWSTLNGWIGNLITGVFFSFDLKAGDADQDNLIFSLAASSVLPPGLSLSSSGIISGELTDGTLTTYFFNVDIQDPLRTVRRQFFLRANFELDDTIAFIPPDGTLSTLYDFGNLQIDEPSYFQIQAQTSGNWVRFEYDSGDLPTGLSIDLVTGAILGKPDPSNTVGDYIFTVRGFNDSLQEVFQDYIITIEENPFYRENRLSTTFTGDDKFRLLDLYLGYNIQNNRVYRPYDKNFGITKKFEVLIQKYIDDVGRDEIFNRIDGRQKALCHPSEFINVPVLNNYGEKICECVVLRVDNDRQGSLLSSVNPVSNETIENASFENIRELVSDISSIDGYDNWQSGFYDTNFQRDRFISNNHGLILGQRLIFINQDIPSPFLNNVPYYVIPIDENEFRLSETLNDALNGIFVEFNINETDRPGYYKTFVSGIPIVYVNNGEGEGQTAILNNAFTDFSDIELQFSFVIYGPTNEREYDNFEWILFFNNFLERGN